MYCSDKICFCPSFFFRKNTKQTSIRSYIICCSFLLQQVKDLENTVSNLRKLLTSREQENVELKNQFSEVRDINEKLQGDLDRHRARASPGPQIAEVYTILQSKVFFSQILLITVTFTCACILIITYRYITM